MQKMCHKNVVRYYSCWVEAMEPDNKVIMKAMKVAKERS